MNAVAIGILVFLLWDVLTHAWQPIDEALAHHQIGDALGNGLVLAAAVGVGLLGLVWVDPFSSRHRGTPVGGPGAATVSDINAASWADAAGRLALMIAVGIGLHNFAEGLAIGNFAAADDISLAALLVVGFGLHNATEGFGVVFPSLAPQPPPPDGVGRARFSWLHPATLPGKYFAKDSGRESQHTHAITANLLN